MTGFNALYGSVQKLMWRLETFNQTKFTLPNQAAGVAYATASRQKVTQDTDNLASDLIKRRQHVTTTRRCICIRWWC